MKLELETFGALLAEKERGFNDELQRAHDSIKHERTKSRDLAAEKARLESDLQKCEAALGGVVAEVERDRGAMKNLRDLEFEVVESRARIEELELKNAELQEALFGSRLVSRGGAAFDSADSPSRDDSRGGSSQSSRTSLMDASLAADEPRQGEDDSSARGPLLRGGRSHRLTDESVT
eukprot:FR735757.1.p1 GENE.FR735757.1~~FR735757.1.p1  ORF type:complete len:206 (+),score=20.06 FR735757.1:87-620(+)